MREFTQTVTCRPDNGWSGNCWQHCIAGLLDLEPTSLPWQEGCDLYWTKDDGTKGGTRPSPYYGNLLRTYLRKHHGLAYVELQAPQETLALVRVADPGWHMMTGLTPRSEAFGGARHVVIGRYGEMVWDPHPSHAGLTAEVRWAFLIPFPADWAKWDIERAAKPDHKPDLCMCPACGKERYMADVACRFVVREEVRGPCGRTDCTDPECQRDMTYRLADGSRLKTPEPGDVYIVPLHAPGVAWCWDGCDGQHLFVRCPDGHDWNVDGRASNCTMKEDHAHRCWVRHGDPTHPETLHVDKAGTTCGAGAGSIQTGSYHGFLHGGKLVAA